MEKLRKDNKNDTKDTKRIQMLQTKVDELEMMIKRLQLEFSWYDSKNDYAHCVINDKLRHFDEAWSPF